MRRILVVNDDGIGAEGIVRLAAAAKNLGEVWVVATGQQCSAMSHCSTVRGSLQIRQEDFPVPGVMAYSVAGTPADCVKVGIRHLMQDRPDVVFSGINCGYNVGVDILYSGTVGFRPSLFPKNGAGRARWRMPIFCLSPKSCWRRGVRRMKYGM